MCRLMSLCLRAEGCEVVEAAGAGDVLARLFQRGEEVDLVVAQGRGPIARGSEVLVALRHSARELPVLVVREPLDLDELRRVVRSLRRP